MSKLPFFDVDELKEIGFSEVGDNIQVSRKCSFHQISGRIGSNVRIDDFCIFKGNITIGSHVHIAAFCSISGAFARVETIRRSQHKFRNGQRNICACWPILIPVPNRELPGASVGAS